MYDIQVRVNTLFGRPWVTMATGLTAREALTLQNKLYLSGDKVRTRKTQPDNIAA